MNKKEHEILKLSKINLKVSNPKRFGTYLNIYSADWIYDEYGKIFVDNETGLFKDFVDSDQIINLIEFDRNVALILLKNLLFFESKFKKVIVDTWVNYYNLKDTKIYNYAQTDMIKLIPNIVNCEDLEYVKFFYSLFEYVSSSEFLMHYKSLSLIPIEELVLSWTFATSINFYRTLDDDVQKMILLQFNISTNYHKIFHKMLNVFLKIRNMISHNHVIYDFNNRLYRIEFNKIYASIKKVNLNEAKNITLDKVIIMLDYLLDWNETKQSFEQELKKVSINQYSKESLIKLIYGMF